MMTPVKTLGRHSSRVEDAPLATHQMIILGLLLAFILVVAADYYRKRL